MKYTASSTRSIIYTSEVRSGLPFLLSVTSPPTLLALVQYLSAGESRLRWVPCSRSHGQPWETEGSRLSQFLLSMISFAAPWTPAPATSPCYDRWSRPRARPVLMAISLCRSRCR